MTDKRGFTLIEILIVIAIIGAIAAISLPNMFQARRKSNQEAAFSTVRNFITAAIEYSYTSDAQSYWINGEGDFGTFFSHKPIRSGYRYFYRSNDATGDTASSFCYLAIPNTYHVGVKACLCDESFRIFVWNLSSQIQIDTIIDNAGTLLVDPDFTKSFNPVTNSYERMAVGTWELK